MVQSVSARKKSVLEKNSPSAPEQVKVKKAAASAVVSATVKPSPKKPVGKTDSSHGEAVQKVVKAAAKTVKSGAAKSATKAAVATVLVADPAGQKKIKKEKKSAGKKVRLERECFFVFPEKDYAKISELKKRALNAGQMAKKSEVLRAGLAVLAGLSDAAFLTALDGLDRD